MNMRICEECLKIEKPDDFNMYWVGDNAYLIMNNRIGLEPGLGKKCIIKCKENCMRKLFDKRTSITKASREIMDCMEPFEECERYADHMVVEWNKAD